jgi:exodeoxyribonuclease V alpha subunit
VSSTRSNAPSATLTGVVERIIFLNEENHYTIAEFRPDEDPRVKKDAKSRPEAVTIVGALPGVECGETLHLAGEWTRHAQHGAQFKVVTFKSELPASVYGIRKYLGSGLVTGIGKVYANKIVDAFGTDTFRILSEESGRLRDVEGIGKKRATAIKQAWDAKRTERELYIFLQTYGVSPSQCVKLVQRYGVQAKAILTHEPYRVAREVDGIGFKTADRIAINLGFANDAPPRIDAGIIFALETLQEEGHTAYGESDLRDYTANLLETDSTFVAARISALVEAKALVRHVDPVAGVADPGRPRSTTSATPTLAAAAGLALIQLPHNDRSEERIAKTVARLTRVASGLPPIKVDAAVEWAEKKAGFAFADLQRAALRHALRHKLSILTGGPGTGKTTILRALVEVLKAKKVRVHLAAPTGRAAQRLAETTGGFASTIHRLLRYDAAAGGFTANENSPLATDFLVVDEASMLDTRLAAALLQAIPSRAHVLLVGDIDQLPSVGAGNVLKDLIATAAGSIGRTVPGEPPLGEDASPSPRAIIPVTRLSTIYRQQGQSQIVTTAHAINSGDPSLPPIFNEVADAQVWSDLNFIAATDAEDCLRKVVQLLTEFVPRALKWPHPVRDVQVLAPMHKGVAGVGNFNLELQGALNANQRGLRAAGAEYRVGDKIIQLRNNYDKNLFNGDIGAVVATDPENSTLDAEFDGTRHTFERGELNDLGLAYAISIHKSQGSEYPVVIVPLLKAHFMMLQRNLLYTAITRGKKKVFIVGDPVAYVMAVRNSEAKLRLTHLREKTADALGA